MTGLSSLPQTKHNLDIECLIGLYSLLHCRDARRTAGQRYTVSTARTKETVMTTKDVTTCSARCVDEQQRQLVETQPQAKSHINIKSATEDRRMYYMYNNR